MKKLIMLCLALSLFLAAPVFAVPPEIKDNNLSGAFINDLKVIRGAVITFRTTLTDRKEATNTRKTNHPSSVAAGDMPKFNTIINDADTLLLQLNVFLLSIDTQFPSIQE